MTVEKKETVFPANFIEAFNTFHSLRNQFKAKVFQTEKILTLIVIIKEWLFMEEDYANYWATLKSKENEIEVFRSKETDPMELLSHLRIINEKLNIYNIEELKSQYNILPHEVKKEVKRLTLLANI